jgi:hypothetical protein
MKVHISLFRWSIGIVAATLLFAVISANSLAGALSGQDALSATNSSKQLLNHVSGVDAGAATSVLPDAAAAGEAAEEPWLSGLHVSGFLSQTFGMWQNSENLRQYTKSRNSLAKSRTWLQVDENLRTNENLFMREWFVYEPPYAWNSANGTGKFGNEFYNQYTVRDAWWENKAGQLTTYVGNQIVVWGQSLAFRVGDVINPVDTTWAFGFANLEQSRIPQWMVHPILNLPGYGPFQSNFLEGVLIPRLQPMWNNCNYADHRYDGEYNVNAGSVNNGFSGGIGFDPAGPFSVNLPSTQRFYPARTALLGGSILPPARGTFSVQQFGPFGALR